MNVQFYSIEKRFSTQKNHNLTLTLMWYANSSFVVSLLNQTFINFQRSKKYLIHWIVKKG